MIETYHTIRKSDKIYPTGNNPILVECNDLNTWICKHGRTTPRLLLNELLGSSFARIWNLRTPDFCLIEVLEEHLPENINIVQPIFFKKHCFGSKFLDDCQVVDYTLLPSLEDKNFRYRIANKNDFLLISLFDIWLGNEDRAPHHTNLMLDFSINKEMYFTVFDHDALFNQIDLGKYEMTLLDDECSLLSSEIATLLFKSNKKFVNNVNQTVENFYLCVEKSKESLLDILSCIPDSWNIKSDVIEDSLKSTIFTEDWIRKCEMHFRYLTQTYIK